MKINKDNFYDISISKGLNPLDEYVTKETKTHFTCMICGKDVYITPRAMSVKTKYGCRGCGQKMSETAFLDRVKELNDSIKIITPYVDSKTKVKCQCNICGCEWERKPNDILTGHYKCPKCVGCYRMTNDEFIEEFSKNENSKTITLLSEFINHRCPIRCKCKIDGYEWEAYPWDILNNRCGCRRCAKNEQYTTTTFKEKLYLTNSDIIVIGDYINSTTRIKCRCKTCGCEWEPIPDNLLSNNTGCPICRGNKSKGEEKISDYLNKRQIDFIQYKRFDDLRGVGNKPLSYDFYIPKFRYLLEYQGKQHEKPIQYFGGEKQLEIQKEHDNRKRNYALNNGYNYKEIWYYDYKKITDILDNIFI